MEATQILARSWPNSISDEQRWAQSKKLVNIGGLYLFTPLSKFANFGCFGKLGNRSSMLFLTTTAESHSKMTESEYEVGWSQILYEILRKILSSSQFPLIISFDVVIQIRWFRVLKTPWNILYKSLITRDFQFSVEDVEIRAWKSQIYTFLQKNGRN